MSSWRQQALIEAPVEEVWRLVGDPESYAAWAKDVVEVTGIPRAERDVTFRQVMDTPLGRHEHTMRVEDLEELQRITLRCTTTGYYSRWLLTPARENTFADVEFGAEPTSLRYRVIAPLGKRWFRRLADESIDALRGILARRA
jgi:uncharacterized protein YndB with AHSA1/START domain